MVKAIMIVEIAGCPAEHVKATLEKHIGAMKLFKDIKVNSAIFSDPKELDGVNKGVFTCFSEVEFETESLSRMCDTVFDFMPSSIEILEPSKLSLTHLEASSLLNNISGRMHKYDEIARFANYKMGQMAEKLKVLEEAGEKKTVEEKPKKKERKKS